MRGRSTSDLGVVHPAVCLRAFRISRYREVPYFKVPYTRHTTQQEQATARSTPSHRALAPAAAVASRKAWAGIQLRHVTRHWLAALVVQSDLCLAYSPASSPRPSPPSAALSIVCTFSVHTIALLTWEPLADWKALLQPSLAAPKLHAHSVDARGQALDSLRRSSGVSATT
jgi:hypothetical protein